MKLTNAEAATIDKLVTDKADSIIAGKRKAYSGPTDPYRNLRDAARMAEEEVWQAVISRTMDKFSRIKSFCQAGITEEQWQDLMDNDFPDAVNYVRILAGVCKEMVK